MRFFFMLLPWLELFTLIQLGIETSALTALFYVFATFVLGMFVLRRQGAKMVERMRDVQLGRVSGTQLLVDDMAMGLAGVLLMFPGMISDFAALIVMIGPLRRRIAARLGVGPEPSSPAGGHSTQVHEHVTIEGDFTRVDDTRFR
ncbi:FxsA family protein [Haliea sp. E17]|uniref:FxsA family protein n=1 Tax=Haliea sp. E17 TaxID=3401576 RepID=UPI003AAD2F8C